MLPKSEGRRYSYRFNNPQKEEAKMLLKEKIRLLSMVDVLEPLSQKELEDFSERIPDTYVERGQVFFTPEDRSEALFLLKKGRMRIYRVAPDGWEFTLAVVEAGTMFGEMALTAQRSGRSMPRLWNRPTSAS